MPYHPSDMQIERLAGADVPLFPSTKRFHFSSDMQNGVSFQGRPVMCFRSCPAPGRPRLIQLVSYADGIRALVLEMLIFSQCHQGAGGHC